MKYNIYSTDDFEFKFEVDSMMYVRLHMEVLNWTPSVLKQMKRGFPDIKEAFRLEGFTHMYGATPSPKFVNLVAPGGRVVEVEGPKTEGITLILWDLEK